MTGNASALLHLPQADAERVEDVLFQLQLEQFDHDEKYHREISRLTMHHRLNHMALHFAKYSGRLSDPDLDPEMLERKVTDTFIIALSCSNILNFRLWERLGSLPVDSLPSLGQKMALDMPEPPMTADALFRWTAKASGRMAAACEKLDHVEDFPFRRLIADAITDLAKGVLVFAAGQNWNLLEMARERLGGVKQKSILHGSI